MSNVHPLLLRNFEFYAVIYYLEMCFKQVIVANTIYPLFLPRSTNKSILIVMRDTNSSWI